MTPLNELSQTLWRQRRLLELLTYKLEVQQLVLASGRVRWLPAAAGEVESVMDGIRNEEVVRAGHVRACAPVLGTKPDASLRELIEVAPAPWDGILNDHRTAFLAMTADIEELTRHNKELLQHGYQATRDLIAAIADVDDVAAYGANGSGQSFRQPVRTLDRSV